VLTPAEGVVEPLQEKGASLGHIRISSVRKAADGRMPALPAPRRQPAISSAIDGKNAGEAGLGKPFVVPKSAGKR